MLYYFIIRFLLVINILLYIIYNKKVFLKTYNFNLACIFWNNKILLWTLIKNKKFKKKNLYY